MAKPGPKRFPPTVPEILMAAAAGMVRHAIADATGQLRFGPPPASRSSSRSAISPILPALELLRRTTARAEILGSAGPPSWIGWSPGGSEALHGCSARRPAAMWRPVAQDQVVSGSRLLQPANRGQVVAAVAIRRRGIPVDRLRGSWGEPAPSSPAVAGHRFAQQTRRGGRGHRSLASLLPLSTTRM